MRNHGILGNDDDAVADEVEFVVQIFRLAGGRDGDVVADARVLVNDGVLDLAIRADADARLAFAFVALHGFLRIRNSRCRG